MKIKLCLLNVYLSMIPCISMCSQGLNLFEALYKTCDVMTTTESHVDTLMAQYVPSIMHSLESIIELIDTQHILTETIADQTTLLIAQMQSEHNDLNSQLTTINNDIDTVQNTINGIQNNVSQILSEFTVNDSQLLSISDALTIKIMDLDTDVANVQNSATTINNTSNTINSTVNTINSAVNSVNSAVNTINTNVNQALTELVDGNAQLLSVSDVLCNKLLSLDTENDALLLSVNDIVCSKLMNLDTDVAQVQTSVNTIQNTANTINTTVNTIQTNVNQVLTELAIDDTQLLSVSDVLYNKITSQDITISQFGDTIDAQRKDYVAVQFHYGIPDNDVSTTLVTTGSVIENDSVSFVSTGTSSTGSAKLTSKRMVPCQAGHETYATFSAMFPQSAVNSTQWIGLFDTVDGVAVGFNGTAFGILHRNNSVDTIVNQSSFNLDRIDGTGVSGFNINKTKLNVFRISYGWYGTAVIKFEVLSNTGSWVTFHQIMNINTSTVAAFSNPCLPMCMQVTNNGNTSDIRIGTTTWRAGVIEGALTNAETRVYSFERLESTLSTSENYMFTVRNRSNFNSKTNKVMVRIVAFGGGNASDITPTILRYYKNGTLAGSPSFSNISTDSSVIEVDTAATSVSGGTLLWSYGAAGLSFEFLNKDSVEFILLPGESLSVTANKFLGLSTLSLYATLTWEEYH